MKTETKWALIATVALAAWLLLSNLLGWHTQEKFATWSIADMVFSVVLFIIVYYMACKEKRDLEYGGVMSWNEGFWTAARMTLVFIPLSVLALYIYLTAVNPDFAAVFAKNSPPEWAGKTPVNNCLNVNLVTTFLFGGLFCLIFPLLTRRSAAAA